VTESEWLACTDPEKMLEFLWGKASKREQRLLVVGFCRHTWYLLSEYGRKSVEVAERFADGRATAQELEEARWAADSNSVEEDGLHQQAELDTWLPRPSEDEELFLRELDYRGDRLHAAMLAHASTFPDEWLKLRELPGVVRWKNAAGLVRCISGNPFRSSPPLPPAILTWNDATVVRLAQAAYEERHLSEGNLDNSRLAVLADALEEAGCTSEEILGHLRGPGPHVRGCWSVDLCLGKS
jgi:hypothetical protein